MNTTPGPEFFYFMRLTFFEVEPSNQIFDKDVSVNRGIFNLDPAHLQGQGCKAFYCRKLYCTLNANKLKDTKLKLTRPNLAYPDLT